MKKSFLAVVLVAIASASFAGPEDAYDKTTDAKKIAWMQKGMEAVKAKLKDPKSSQFRRVYFHKGADRIPMTCGEVNSKNGFGGYGGFQKFVSAGKTDLTFLEDQVEDFATVWNRLCLSGLTKKVKTREISHLPQEVSPVSGRILFNGKGVCMGCHGSDGNSEQIPDYMIDKISQLNPQPTNLRTSTSLQEKTDAEIFMVIKYGKPGTSMVPMTHVSDDEIWHLVSYIREINQPFAISGVPFAQVTKPGTYYVTESVLEEHLAPSTTGSVTNRIYRRQKVEVFEVKSGWARVSKYYDGAVERKSGQVARWVLAKGLSSSQPAELPQPTPPSDTRIAKDAFPKVGQSGLTEQDVQLLYKGALKHLNSGKCQRVDYGDKSTSKVNTYYINCGGPNILFTAADVR